MATRKRLRGNGEGSVYPVKRKRRRNGKDVEVTIYEGFVTLGIVGTDQRRKYATAPTKAECTAKIRALLNQRDEGTLTLTSSPTVEEWLEYYLLQLAPRKKAGKGGTTTGNRPNTLASYKGLARNWAYPRVGKVKLEKLTPEHLEAVYLAMADAGLATSTIGSADAMFRVALDVAWKRGRIPRNVALLATRPEGKAAPATRELTVEEMQRVLEVARRRGTAAKWVTRLAYGIRQGECLGLAWPQVDFEKREIWMTQQLQRDRAEHGCGKPSGVQKIPAKKDHGCGEPTGTETTRPRIKHGCGDPTGTTSVDVAGHPMRQARKLYPCGANQPSRCPQVVKEGGGKEIPVYPCGKRRGGDCPEATGTDAREVPLYPCGKRQPAKCPQAIGGGLHLVPLKTRASQAPLPMPGPIAELLLTERTAQKRRRVEEGPRWTGWVVGGKQAQLVFSQANGRPLDVHDDWEEWHDMLAEAGVDPVKPHAARGFAATLLVALGVHPRVAMEMLRHADVSTTLNLYSKAPSADLRNAADELASVLLGKAVGG